MAIGTPTYLGSIGNASTPSSLAITTVAAINAHDVVVLLHYSNGGNSAATSVTDTTGNTYFKLVSLSATAPIVEVYLCVNASAMASSNSITIPSFTNSALRHGMYALSISGLLQTPTNAPGQGVVDLKTTLSTPVSQTTTTPTSVAVGQAAAAQEIYIGFLMSGGNMGTFTPGGSWTAMGTLLNTNAWIYPAYQIVSSVSAVNWAPTVGTSATLKSWVFSLVGTPAANTSRQAQGSLTGVGA